MIADILAIAFITTFSAIVVLGHVLLFRAIWSGRGATHQPTPRSCARPDMAQDPWWPTGRSFCPTVIELTHSSGSHGLN